MYFFVLFVLATLPITAFHKTASLAGALHNDVTSINDIYPTISCNFSFLLLLPFLHIPFLMKFVFYIVVKLNYLKMVPSNYCLNPFTFHLITPEAINMM